MQDKVSGTTRCTNTGDRVKKKVHGRTNSTGKNGGIGVVVVGAFSPLERI